MYRVESKKQTFALFAILVNNFNERFPYYYQKLLTKTANVANFC